MPLLALDVGSSSVKAAVLRGTRPLTPIATAPFPTRYSSHRAEVDPAHLLRAVARACADLSRSALKKADALALSVMSPAWIALDKKGKPLTPLITHQDRRSLAEAHVIEQRIGSKRHLHITGNPPVPGGISSTTFTYFLHHHPALMRRAALTGHLNTFLIHHLTHQRAIDPSNASFTGLYETTTQGSWSAEILSALKIFPNLLPDILPANEIAGHLLPSPARALGLRPGLPVLTGLIDTSSAMLLADRHIGQLLNVSGSTDVLCVLTNRPHPSPHYLTRALGTAPTKLWLHVSTLPAAGSALTWARAVFFPDLSDEQFFSLARKLANHPDPAQVTFSPHLAGSRTTIDQPTANFQNLTLSTTRQNLLSALIESLAAASAQRLPLLQQSVPRLLPNVLTSGGTLKSLAKILLRDWPPTTPRSKWSFHYEPQATLRGLGKLLDL